MRQPKTFVRPALALAIAALLSPVARGQLIQVSPGYVKAPLVRVYTYNDGSSYVRAPLVGVWSPGYGGGGHWDDETNFAAMNWRQLGAAVREWATKLNADLDHNNSGAFWKTNLKTAEILALVPSERDEPPTADARRQLQAIREVFDTVDSSDLNGVASFTSFQMLHDALAEYSSAPHEHVGRQVNAAAHDLYRALRQFNTGDTWQRYLLEEPGLVAQNRRRDATPELPAIPAAREALTRFDSVRQNAEYAQIADVPEFRATYEALVSYVKQQPIPPPPAEELPQPAAKK